MCASPDRADRTRTGKKSVDATSYVGRIMPSMPSSRVLALAAITLLLPATMLAAQPAATRIPVIVDTDANNELDDQHALAYVLLNGDTFDVKGVTVNATRGGGDIREHYEEARRVMALCGVAGIPLHAGANGIVRGDPPDDEAGRLRWQGRRGLHHRARQGAASRHATGAAAHRQAHQRRARAR